MSAESKALEKLAQLRTLLQVWVGGPERWKLSGIDGQYESYHAWLAVATAHDPAFAAVVAAGATQYDTILIALNKYYRSLEPPPPPPVVDVPPTGIPSPGQPQWFDRWGDIVLGIDVKLEKIAKAMGIILVLLLFVGVASAQVNVTFAWDASDTPSTATHPIGYRLHLCSNETLTACQTNEAGQNLEKQLQLGANSLNWVYATCYWDLIEGQPNAGIVESEKSNVLRIQIFSPPGNPKNPRIKVVTVAKGKDGQAILVAKAE